MSVVINAICKQCSEPFSFEATGIQRRSFCTPCVVQRKKERSLKHGAAIKRAKGELTAMSAKSGSFQMAARSRSAVAEDLASYEFWERVSAAKKAGKDDEEVCYHKLTTSRIHQIERAAIMKLRKALTPYLRDQTNDSRSDVYPEHTPGETIFGVDHVD